jgi:hypothetical protein
MWAQGVHFSSPTGSSTNAGTITSPWSLSYALNGAQGAGKIKAGDTIYLLGGTYKGHYVSHLGFSGAKPIIVKNYKDERASIDGYIADVKDTTALTINGVNTWFIGLEVLSSNPNRIASGSMEGSYPKEISFCDGITVYGKDIKIINCIVHDMTGTGISSWKYSDNNEIYGCFIYNNGSVTLSDSSGANRDRGNGPGFYIQHLDASKPKMLVNNFVFKNFSNGIQAKTVIETPGHALNGIYMDSNTVFNGGALNFPTVSRKYNLYLGSEIQPANPAENIYVRSNVFYRDETDGTGPYLNGGDGQWKPAWYRQSNVSLGAGQADSFVQFRNNHIVGSSYAGLIYVRNSFAQFDFQNNTLYDPIGAGALVGVEYFSLYKPTDSVRLKGTWNNNRYFSKNTAPFWRFRSLQTKDKTLSLQEFRSVMKVDANSIQPNNSMPADTAFVRPNKYEPNTYFVTVLNYSKKNNYVIALANASFKGLYYTITDIQDYYGGQVTSGLYNGTSIELSMGLVSVSAPLGQVPLQPQHTSAALGTFVIRFTTNAPDGLSCNPPTNLEASYTSNSTGIKLTWNAASEGISYVIQKQNGANWDSIASTTSNTYTVNNLQAYGNYSFRVGTKCLANSEVRFSSVVKSPGIYFVADNGTANGTGTVNQPWSLAYVLGGAGGKISAGDSIFLRGGVYKGNFTAVNLTGTETKPIVFRNYKQEAAVIDGFVANNALPALTVAASCNRVYIVGLELKSSSPSRMSAVAGDMYTGSGIHVQGGSVKIINCIIHDMPGDGVTLDRVASETEVYGCLIYNNGVERALASSGNGISVQNMDSELPKNIVNNFVFRNSAQGVFVYGASSASTVSGINIDSTTIFNTGSMLTNTLARKYNLLVGGSSSNFSAKDISITNNVIYRDETDGAGSDKPHNLRYNISFGQGNVTDSSMSFLRNHIVGGGYYGSIYVQSNFLKYNLQQNVFYTPDANNKLVFIKSGLNLSPVWNNNQYFSNNSSAFNGLSFNNWQATYAADANSTYNTGKPSDAFFIRRNKYDPDVFYVTVLNHAKSAVFRLPFVNSALAGRTISVIDVQNYFGQPIATATYNGTYIDIPMSSTIISAPVGTVATQPQHSSSNLGTFIIRLGEIPEHCPGNNTSFTSDISGTSYQWQVNTGSGFTNLANGTYYMGVNTATLQLVNMPYSLNENEYRCVVDSKYSSTFHLKLKASIWTGAVSNAWENPANWACGVVPSGGSEVIIDGGTVVLGSNGICGSISLKNNAHFTVKSGYTLTITELKQ